MILKSFYFEIALLVFFLFCYIEGTCKIIKFKAASGDERALAVSSGLFHATPSVEEGMEMDQNGGEMGNLNQNGRLPVGVTVWYPCVFCESGQDTYAYWMSFMYVHVGGRAWIFNMQGVL